MVRVIPLLLAVKLHAVESDVATRATRRIKVLIHSSMRSKRKPTNERQPIKAESN